MRVFVVFVLCFVLAQADRHDQDVQQIQRTVKRINLSDFGFTQKKNVPQRGVDERFKKGTDDRTYRPAEPGVERELSGERTIRGRPAERDYSSPLDWTTSVRRVGDNVNARVDSRLEANEPYPRQSVPYDRPFRPEPVRPRRNCSAECVPDRYLKHYLARDCRPLTDAECNCALSFHCPPPQTDNSTVCLYDGRTYRVGSRIPVPNPCRVCECRKYGRGDLTEVVAHIECGVSIECPEEVFGVRPEPNCYFAYQHDQCCGQQVCPDAQLPKRQQKVCTYRGRQYKKGQKIYPEEDSCLTCICDDSWRDDRPMESASCRRHRCEFDLDRDYKNGCLPIYHEGTCCPIEYLCPNNTAVRPEVRHPNYCYFDSREYPLGARLNSGNVCVDCVCRAPPDFTCVHQMCPTRPHNCFVAKWDNSVCCQDYSICSSGDRVRDRSLF